MPNEPVPADGINLNLLGLGQSLGTDSTIPLQPVSLRLDDGLTQYYTASAPEFIGSMPVQQDITILPQYPPSQGIVNTNSVYETNYWGSSGLVGLAEPLRGDQGFQPTSNSGFLYLDGLTNNITFFSGNQTESLRIEDNGDFFIQGRLVKNDLEIYQAFRKFLGLSYEEPTPKPRDGIETRYQRICKKCVED